MNSKSYWSFAEDAVPRSQSSHQSHTNSSTKKNFNFGNGHTGAFHTIDDLSKKWKYLVESGDATAYSGDRSRLVAAIIRHCLNLRWSPDEILPLITSQKYGASAHCHSKSQQDGNTVEWHGRRQIDHIVELMNSNFKTNHFGKVIPDDPHNIALAFYRLTIEFRYNEFDQRIYYYKDNELQSIDDAELEVIAMEIYKEFGWHPGQRALQRFVTAASRENRFHPVREHLAHLQTLWEQKHQPPSLTTHWLIHLAGAPDNPLIRSQSQLILIAAVRRIRQPGCKFDEMLVLQGIEGTNKSSALERLALKPEFFTDNFPLHERSSQRVQERLRGRFIVECSELAGYDQANSEHFKSMLSRTNDSVRQAYGRLPVESPRQCIFFGSTNEKHFLTDNSNRRIWPVPVTSFDLKALDAVLDDLWGEAAFLESTGMSIRLDPSLWSDAGEQQRTFKQRDPWTDELQNKLGDLNGFITARDAFLLLGSNAAAMRVPNANRRLTMAMTDADLGFQHKRKHVNNRLVNGFYRGNDIEWIYAYLSDPQLREYRASNSPDEGNADTASVNF
jgi:predicted P-loop ATPase